MSQKDDAILNPVRLCEGVDHRIGTVAPLVVRADVGKVDVAVDGEGDTQAAAFPWHSSEFMSGDFQGPQMLWEGRWYGGEEFNMSFTKFIGTSKISSCANFISVATY